MSIFNNTLASPRPMVYVRLAESVTGTQRKTLEDGLSLTPGFQHMRVRINDVEHVVFRTTPERASALLAGLPPSMKGLLLTQMEYQVKTVLCPATP